jgi:3-hydroxyisobutyrate dehydrogenase-like beta-hydroxyacid dehydrogenase
MAGQLLKAGFTVHGFDVDEGKRDAFRACGGIAANSVTELTTNAQIILLSLATVAALVAVTEELAGAVRPGQLCIELGTFGVDDKHAARRRLAPAGVELMDAPVSGTGLQAAQGQLVVLASGTREAFDRSSGVFAAIGRSSHYLGEFGNGSVMKYIANVLVVVHNLVSAEAHTLGIAAGLDPAAVQAVTSDGIGASKIFDIRGPMMVADTYEPPSARMDLTLKDIKVIRSYAASVGAPTPLLDTAEEYYQLAVDSDMAGLDPAALCRLLEQRAGLHRRPT